LRAHVDGNIWASAGWGGEGLDGVHIFAPDGQLLVGAFIADDLDALIAQEILTANPQVSISGNQATARAWQAALARLPVRAVVLADEEIENGFLAGLGTVLSQAISAPPIQARAI
jgi:hypothetical protein